MSSRRSVITTSGFGGFLLPVCICRQHKLSLEPLAWLHMKTWMYPSDFSICGMPNQRYAWNQFFAIWGALCFPTKIWGTVTDMGKILGGSVANIYLEKVTEAFQKIPSSFGAVVRKPGLGVNYPPPTCNTRVKSHFQSLKAHGAALISVSLALSRTPAEAARPRGQCVAWYARLLPAIAGIHQPTPEGWHAEELKCYTTGNNEHKIYKNPKLARKCRKINMGAPYTEKKHTT